MPENTGEEQSMHKEPTLQTQAWKKARYIIRSARFNSSTRRAIDVGCGNGFIAHLAKELFPELERMIGIDKSQMTIRHALPGMADLIVADMDSMPFENDYFDLGFAHLAVHYSTDLPRTMEEISRIIRPGGSFYVMDVHPIFSMFIKESHDYERKENAEYPAWEDQEISMTHPTFTFSEYVEAMVSAGFKIVEVREIYGRRSAKFSPYRIPTMITFLLSQSNLLHLNRPRIFHHEA